MNSRPAGVNLGAEGLNSGAEGVHSWVEGVNSGAQGEKSWTEGVNSGAEGLNSWAKGSALFSTAKNCCEEIFHFTSWCLSCDSDCVLPVSECLHQVQ